MSTTSPATKTQPISILKPSLRSPQAGPSVPKTAHIMLSEDEEEDDPRYGASDGEDEDPASMPTDQALELLQTEKVCHAGYLLKKGEKRRTWKKRWFVLRTTKLAMYKDKKEYKLLRIIDLHDVHSVVQVTSKNKYRHVFAIITPKRMYYVQADDQRTMNGWFDAIERTKQELRLYDADDDESSAHRDQEFAKDLVSSYKSNASSSSNPLYSQLPSQSTPSASQHQRRGSAPHLDGRRPSASNLPVDSSSTSPPQVPPILVPAPAMTKLASTSPITKHPKPSSPRIQIPSLDSSPQSSSPSSSHHHPPHQVTFSSSLSEYTTGQIYPVSPTFDPAQSHLSDGLASSEDDEEYSATNSVIDLKKEEDRNRVLVEGYLLKLGRNKGWQKRWFVLRTDTLAYYENNKEYSPHRIIPLTHIIDSLEIDAISKSKQYCFKIIIPKRNYVLCASTESDMESWLDALSVATRRLKKDPKAAAEPTTSPTSPTAGDKHLKHHIHHQAMRLERIPEMSKLPESLRRLSLESFENTSHISGVSGAGGVGGAGGALGRR
ncbi:PH domain-like protein [Hesseltinella vesiculosa]|uniref:PH domain-like protein n=1 Tax=Hesseltinella vesiculosa TaxID=101127 RepID=A0A1X2GIW3_9FUNG|nr:PH domain-like protein [Hesseltinella vesiculosa]